MAAKDSAPHGFPSSERPSVGEVIFVVESCKQGGFTARGLGQSVFAQGETLDLLQADIRSAVACHFDEDAVPGLIRLQIGTEQIVLQP
jgi:hypothetical protein